MISVIARNKGDVQNRYNSTARVLVRFFESFAPFVCGIELLPDRPEAARLWVDAETAEMSSFLTMLNAFVNPWTGGQNTVEVVADDFDKWGGPRLK